MNKLTKTILDSDPSRTFNAKIALDGLEWKVKNLGPKSNIEQSKGYIFEFLENASYNAERGSKGLRYENTLTGMPKEQGGPGDFKSPIDMKINGTNYQLKTHGNIDSYLVDLNNKKYADCDFIVPADHYKQLQEKLYQRYQENKITRREFIIQSNRVHKGYNSYNDLLKYGNNNGNLSIEATEREIKKAINKECLLDCKNITSYTTISYLISGCATSSIKNIKKLREGKIDKKECVKNICKDTAKSSGKGLAVGALASSLYYIGHSIESGNILQSGSVSLTISNGVFDLGAAFNEYLSGNISFTNFAEQIVTKTVIVVSSLLFRLATIKSPFIGTLTMIAISSISNELLYGLKSCECDGDAKYFQQNLEEQIKTQNLYYLCKTSQRIRHNKVKYEKANEYINYLATNNNPSDVMFGLIEVSKVLELDIQFDSFDEFKHKMINKEEIII